MTGGYSVDCGGALPFSMASTLDMCDCPSGVEVSVGVALMASELLTGLELGEVDEVEDGAAAVLLLLLRKGELTLRSTAPNGLDEGREDEASAALLTITGALYNDMLA